MANQRISKNEKDRGPLKAKEEKKDGYGNPKLEGPNRPST